MMLPRVSRQAAACAILVLTLCSFGASQVPVITYLGPGCGSSPPSLAVTPPAIGGTTSFTLTTPFLHAMVFMAISNPIAPPYPMIGSCPIYVDLANADVIAMVGMTDDVTGSFHLDVAVPFEESIVGASKNIQFLVWPMGQGSDGLSEGVQLTVGIPSTPCQALHSCIQSNFNGTPIAGGRTIWFNAVIKLGGVPTTGGILHFDASQVDFTAGGVSYTVSVPAALILYDPAATTASTVFDVGTGEWHTTVPAGYTGDVFLSGSGFDVSPALPGGINPVTWCGSMGTNVGGATFQWKWAAAVYSSFPSDPNAIGVKPVDSNSLSIYANSDHAGTPESAKGFVVGGARGGGGSNWTGSYSATLTTACQ
jgi:hypothetical protein